MDIKVEEKSTKELFSTPLLQQTAFWSDVKENLGYKGFAYNLKVREKELKLTPKATSSYLFDDMLILSKPVNQYSSIAYVPYGPLLTPNEEVQGEFIEELSEELRTILPSSTILIRYDLPWKQAYEESDENLALKELRINFGTDNHNIRHSSSNILPNYTTILDLSGSEEEILMRMKSKTRYNIRLAYRKGVYVKEGTRADLPIFLKLYEDTSLRNGIRFHDSQFFEALYLATEEDAKFSLLIAFYNDVPTSAMFLTITDQRATYLYGASSSENRDSMSTYALQFEAIRRAKALGATEYDMFGIGPKDDDSNPLSGLSKFKLGFGGECFSRMGCWDYPLKQEDANSFFAQELNWQKYHIG